MSDTIEIHSMVEERKELFIDLYKKSFPAVAKYISRRGGSYEEAKDVFQEALVIYYERITSDIYSIENDHAYLTGIAKHLWIKRYRENNQHVGLDHLNSHTDTTAEEETPSSGKLMQLLETAGQKCMEMLSAFYYDKLPLSSIVSRFGYSSVRSATVQKYKCLEKVRDTIKEKSLAYEDFLE